jgi:hypothetical protein
VAGGDGYYPCWKKLREAHKEATGGLKAAILERTVEKARKVCKPVRMTLRMTKTVPITEKGNGKEVCRLARLSRK